MSIRSFGTRERSIITSIIIALLLFLLVSPLINNYLKWLVIPPEQPTNVLASENEKEVDFSWDAIVDEPIKGFNIYLNGTKVNTQLISVDNFSIYNLVDNAKNTVVIETLDNFGKTSKSTNYIVESSAQPKQLTFNIPASNSKIVFLSETAIFIAVLLFLLNLWVLFFKVNFKTAIIIGAFPSVCLFSYLILSLSFYDTLNSIAIKLAISTLIALGGGILSYLFILTSNILNGSLQTRLPLAQAAKATEFIFGLISTYLMMIYLFSVNLDLYLRIVILVGFITYFSYSSLSMLQTITEYQVLFRVFAIVLTVVLSAMVFSIWPVNAIYVVLAISVVYYILLNVALEIRSKIGKSIWIEYIILLALIFLLFASNAIWGIRGTLI